MKDKFYRPAIIWFWIWLAIFVSVFLIGSWQANLYSQEDLAKSSRLEILTVRTVLPYAISYLEGQKQPDLLQRIFDANFGPYALVLTDGAGQIKYAPRSWSAGKIGPGLLQGKEFYYLLKDSASRISVAGPYLDGKVSAALKGDAEALGKLYLLAKTPESYLDSLNFSYWKFLTPSKSVLLFTLVSYALVLIGFAAICAITARFQRHFQEVQESQHEAELETRELRIQVLESKIKSEDLRLQLLDRNLEKAQTRLNEAKGTIAEMESAIHYESTKNEELQDNLRRAEAEKTEALTSIQDIEQDREKITKELKELEALREWKR